VNSSRSSDDTVATPAASGDYPATLAALRDRLAREIDRADQPRDVAVLSARLADVLAQLQAVKPAEKSVKDELAKKRTQRRAAARKSGTANTTGTAGGK
jgi:hypothetical protein